MKQFIVDRHTTPNTPILEQVPTEKIPIYENRAAVIADLANLTVGQIVATSDTGNEVAQPVDVVEKDNLHAVTSNAVSESLSYSTTEQKTGGVWIDGKPIYRKVFDNLNYGQTINSWVNTGAIVSDIDTLIKGTALRRTSTTQVNCVDNFVSFGKGSNGNIQYLTYDAMNNQDTLIVEYTKTTD